MAYPLKCLENCSLVHFISMTNFSRLNVDVAFHFMGTQFCMRKWTQSCEGTRQRSLMGFK